MIIGKQNNTYFCIPNNILNLIILILEVYVSATNKLEIIIKIMYASLKKLFERYVMSHHMFRLFSNVL